MFSMLPGISQYPLLEDSLFLSIHHIPFPSFLSTFDTKDDNNTPMARIV